MFITHIESKNTRNWFRYETFIYLFEFKVFRHEERETQFPFYADFSISPHHVWHPRRKLLVWPRRALKIDLLVRSLDLNSQLTQLTCSARSAQNRLASPRSESQLTPFFFQIPKILSASGQRHSRPRSYFLSGVFIVTSLIVTSTPRAREHLRSMCAPNPCTKRKVLSLTKQKDQIYLRNNSAIILHTANNGLPKRDEKHFSLKKSCCREEKELSSCFFLIIQISPSTGRL